MAADILVAVVERLFTTADTSTRQILGGMPWTPKAAIFLGGRNNGVAGTSQSHAIIGIGAAEESGGVVSEWAWTKKSRNASSGDDDGRGTIDEAFMLNGISSAIDGEFNLVNFVQGGCTIVVGNPFNQDVYITAIFFGGADLTAAVGTIEGNDGGAIVETIGFQADIILFSSLIAEPDAVMDDVNNRERFSSQFGVVKRNGAPPHDRACVVNRHDRSSRSTPNRFSLLLNDRVGGMMEDGGDEEFDLNVTAFSATGFTTDAGGSQPPDGGVGNPQWGYLALKLAGVSVWAGLTAAPTATGTKEHTEPGFTPLFAMLFPTTMSTLNTAQSQNSQVGNVAMLAMANEGSGGLSPKFLQCHAVGTDNSPQQTAGQFTRGLHCYTEDPDTDAFNADTPAFTANGFQFNYTTVLGTPAKQWVGWAIEVPGVTSTQQAVGGTQPSGTGTPGPRVIFTAPAVGGTQPGGTGAVTTSVTFAQAVAGTQPSGSGDVSLKVDYSQAVAGAQPSGSGVVTTEVDYDQAVAGVQPSGSGAVTTKLISFTQAAAGTQPAGTGVIVTVELGSLDRAVSGVQPSGSAILTIVGRKQVVAGLQPSGSGEVVTKIIQKKQAVVGVQPSGSGAVVIKLILKQPVAGAQPSGSGDVTTATTFFEAVAGTQPSGSVVVTTQVVTATYVDINEVIEVIDADIIPANAIVAWEVHFKSDIAQTHRSRLFNITDGVSVIGSEVQTSLTDIERKTSVDIRTQLTGIKEYKGQYTPSTGPKPDSQHVITDSP